MNDDEWFWIIVTVLLGTLGVAWWVFVLVGRPW